MQDFFKKIAYLIAFLPLFYGACALVQFTVLRPKTRYVVIGSFATLAALLGLMGLLYVGALPDIVARTATREGRDPVAAADQARQSGRLLLVVAGVTLLPLVGSVRRLLGRLTPLDPQSTVDISGLIVLGWVVVLAGFSLFTVDLAQVADKVQITVADAITSVLAYPLIALSLIGVFITRGFREGVKRLGIERLDARRIGVAFGLVVPLLALGVGVDAIGRRLQPGLYGQLEQVLRAMSSNITNPGVALILGLSAGIGEEILFRGAIQPRFGIGLTALVFALAHNQYGASYAVAGIFLTGILLGYERKYLNTTACIITHATYDVVAFMLAYLARTGG